MLLLYFHSGRPIVIEKRYIAKFKVGQQRPTFFFSSYRKSELYCTFYIIA